MEQFKLPDGCYTTDINKYAQDWNAIGEILAKKYNVEILGFDPIVRIYRKGFVQSTADLPMWLVREMIKD